VFWILVRIRNIRMDLVILQCDRANFPTIKCYLHALEIKGSIRYMHMLFNNKIFLI
jgi:hypothetical protein